MTGHSPHHDPHLHSTPDAACPTSKCRRRPHQRRTSPQQHHQPTSNSHYPRLDGIFRLAAILNFSWISNLFLCGFVRETTVRTCPVNFWLYKTCRHIISKTISNAHAVIQLMRFYGVVLHSLDIFSYTLVYYMLTGPDVGHMNEFWLRLWIYDLWRPIA